VGDESSTPLGVIEGFFGRPWGDAARLAAAPFLRARGFEFYLYAPKTDRYLRRQWREPIPPAELTQLATLAAACRQHGLRIGIGLTPFELHRDYSGAVQQDLRDKVRQLNSIGIDILCVLFDDMHGAVPQLAQLQARAVRDVSDWTTAQSLMLCPTYYSDDPVLGRVFGPPPARYLEELGAGLDPAVDICWTGERVCSSGYSDRHLEQVTERLGRKPFIWDNHIANDGRERCSHLFLDSDATGWSVSRERIAGLMINPMNQPTLSRLPLAALAAQFLRTLPPGGRPNFGSLARSLCGDALGTELTAACEHFQNQGIATLGRSERDSLIESFSRYEPERCATEVVGWLRGEYEFDPQCLLE
jgi:hyaluronoglucosaminidase